MKAADETPVISVDRRKWLLSKRGLRVYEWLYMLALFGNLCLKRLDL